MRINSTGPSFGSALTVRNMYLDGNRIYTKYSPMIVSGSKEEKLVNAVMKSFRLNLKEKVDTPVAKKMLEIVPDLYYKSCKKTDVLILPDLTREVNLLTGAEAFTFENIYNNLDRKARGPHLERAISEMFNKDKGIFKGHIDIYASTRDMVEKEGKKLFELIAIDDVVKV